MHWVLWKRKQGLGVLHKTCHEAHHVSGCKCNKRIVIKAGPRKLLVAVLKHVWMTTLLREMWKITSSSPTYYVWRGSVKLCFEERLWIVQRKNASRPKYFTADNLVRGWLWELFFMQMTITLIMVSKVSSNNGYDGLPTAQCSLYHP